MNYIQEARRLLLGHSCDTCKYYNKEASKFEYRMPEINMYNIPNPKDTIEVIKDELHLCGYYSYITQSSIYKREDDYCEMYKE